MKLIKYIAAKRNMKAPRGRVLVGKEGVAGIHLNEEMSMLAALRKEGFPAPQRGRLEQGTQGRRMARSFQWGAQRVRPPLIVSMMPFT